MNQGQIIIWCVKLVLGGIEAFLAILLWSKSRNGGWMSLVASVLISYAGIILNMMTELGIISLNNISVLGIPVIDLCFTAIPSILLIIALILFIKEAS